MEGGKGLWEEWMKGREEGNGEMQRKGRNIGRERCRSGWRRGKDGRDERNIGRGGRRWRRGWMREKR